MVFDKLDIEYIYEPETFELYHNQRKFGYLIDFFLPNQHRFIEIKNMGSIVPTYNECLKAKCLAEQHPERVPCSILYGPISNTQNIKYGSARTYFPDGTIQMPQLLTECPRCNYIDFCTDGIIADLSCECIQDFPEESNYMSHKIVSVLSEVRKHRFWK
jgi:hypothetical protein